MVVVEVRTSTASVEELLRYVEAGEGVDLRRDGRPIARLSPVTHHPSEFDRAIAEGRVRPPSDLRPWDWDPLVADDGTPWGAVDALIAERDAER